VCKWRVGKQAGRYSAARGGGGRCEGAWQWQKVENQKARRTTCGNVTHRKRTTQWGKRTWGIREECRGMVICKGVCSKIPNGVDPTGMSLTKAMQKVAVCNNCISNRWWRINAPNNSVCL